MAVKKNHHCLLRAAATYEYNTILEREVEIMGASIIEQDGALRVLRITGLLRKSEMDDVQATVVHQREPKPRFKLLVILEGFQGWEKEADWGDVTFFATS